MKNNARKYLLFIFLIIFLLSSCDLFFFDNNNTPKINVSITRPNQNQNFSFSDFITFEFDKDNITSGYKDADWSYKGNTLGSNKAILSIKASYFGYGNHTVILSGTANDGRVFNEKIDFSIVVTAPGLTIIF